MNWERDFDDAEQAQDTAAYAYRTERQALLAQQTQQPLFQAADKLPKLPKQIEEKR